MSKFLGPIHHWLFTKVRLHEALEKDLITSFAQKFGQEINDFATEIANIYGTFIEDKPLDQLIDTGNIHGWLQNQISITETRQAAFLTKVLRVYGKDAVEIALTAYKNQGTQCGTDAKFKGETDSAPAIYKSLNNYILEGMPCDHVNNITVAEPHLVEWKNTRCLHREYWESVKADIDIMYQLRMVWIKAFVEAANADFSYHVVSIDGDETANFVHTILKK
ncbi:hypothetical protein QBE52_07920 [Clostridiaceae bacterium 35-E11]